MTDNTNIRGKSRAVFLAALMLLSVFAMSASFAGTAAAQNAGEPVDATSIEEVTIEQTQVLTDTKDADRGTGNFDASGINLGGSIQSIRLTPSHLILIKAVDRRLLSTLASPPGLASPLRVLPHLSMLAELPTLQELAWKDLTLSSRSMHDGT